MHKRMYFCVEHCNFNFVNTALLHTLLNIIIDTPTCMCYTSMSRFLASSAIQIRFIAGPCECSLANTPFNSAQYWCRANAVSLLQHFLPYLSEMEIYCWTKPGNKPAYCWTKYREIDKWIYWAYWVLFNRVIIWNYKLYITTLLGEKQCAMCLEIISQWCVFIYIKTYDIHGKKFVRTNILFNLRSWPFYDWMV